MDIKVSVICTAYNHEKYIRQCLEGIVSQRTTFDYEILVHDDASTDSTASIIREYENKYPNLIRAVYQTENKYSRHIPIAKNYLFPLAKGKYFAFCEGDDWWEDPSKLQKQFEAMEQHPECTICVHPVKLCAEDGSYVGKYQPKLLPAEGKILAEELVKRVMTYQFFQTSSYFISAKLYRNLMNNPPDFKKICPVGDVTILLYSAIFGEAYYIDEPMSCYRTNSVGSWTERTLNQGNDKKIAHMEEMKKSFEQFDIDTKGRFHEICKTAVWEREWRIALLSEQKERFRDLLRGENQAIFLKRSSREKASILGAAFFPHILSAFRTIRERLLHE